MAKEAGRTVLPQSLTHPPVRQVEQRGNNDAIAMSYCLIRKHQDKCICEGQPACSLGHMLDAQPGEEADGIYANWRWDGSSLIVSNDRYGMFPVFYTSTAGTFGISSSIGELLHEGAPADLDVDGLCVFLRLGFFLADKTPFKYVRALPPVSRCRWQDGTLRLDEGHLTVTERTTDRDSAIDQYVERFRHAVRRRFPAEGKNLLFLTGGRDSRHILFEMLRTDTKPDLCLTSNGHPSTSDEDVRVARQLAERFDLSHATASAPSERLTYEQRKNEVVSFSSLEHGWYLVLGDIIRREGWDNVYEGIGGDVLSAGLFMSKRKLELYRKERYEELANLLMPLEREVLLEQMVEPELMRRLPRQQAVALLAEELRRYRDWPNPIAAFYFWNRTRRSIALCPFAICHGAKHVYVPYMDKDVFDLLASLPGEMMVDTTFHDETIARAFPEHKNIPYAAKGGKRRRSPLHQMRTLKDLLIFVHRHQNPLLKRGTIRRILRTAVDKRYRNSVAGFTNLIVYLTQIGQYTDNSWLTEQAA